MKKFMKKSSLALLLAVVMLLSAVTMGSALFAVSAEETEAEATLTYGDNEEHGTLTALANKVVSDSTITGATITLNKDVEVTEILKIRVGGIEKIEGNGNTISFAASLLTSVNTFLIKFPDGATSDAKVTFENVNFSGQPSTWKIGDEMKSFGAGGTATAAMEFYAQMHLTLKNCRMENFKANGAASCFYYQSPAFVATNDRGLFLEDTVITGNYALKGTYGENATVLRTRNGNTTAELPYAAFVYLKGNTIIENNYDKDGDPYANLYLARSSRGTYDQYADNQLIVDESFTGRVGLTGEDYISKNSASTVQSAYTIPSNIYFENYQGGADERVGKIFCVSGGTKKIVFPSDDTSRADTASNIRAAAFRFKKSGDTSWTYYTTPTLTSSILSGMTTGSAASDNVIQLVADVALERSLLNAKVFFTLNGNGHTVLCSDSGAPVISINTTGSDVVFNNVVFDGNVKVTEGDDGYLDFTHISDGSTAQTYIGSGDGGFIRTYSSGITLRMNNVEIKNFVMARAANDQNGAALHLRDGSTAYFNNVNIHDCYSNGGGPVIYVRRSDSNGSAKLYLSGDCSFENNWRISNGTTADATKFEFIRKEDIAVYGVCYLSDDFTTNSLIFSDNKINNGEQFATLSGSTLNENANLVNATDAALYPIASGTSVKWTKPVVKNTVTINVLGKNGTTSIISYVTELTEGEALPTWSGVIWKTEAGTETAVHIANETKYNATWDSDTTTVALVSRDNGETWTVATSLKDSVNSETINRIEVLGGADGTFLLTEGTITIPSNTTPCYLDFNNFVVKRSAVVSTYHIQTALNGSATSLKHRDFTIANAVFDGENKESEAFVGLNNYSTGLKFENCEFKNFKGTGERSVIRALQATDLTLINVKMYDNYATNGAIRAHTYSGVGSLALKLYLGGHVEIYNHNDTTKYPNEKCNVVYNVGVIQIIDDFTGNVEIAGDALQRTQNAVVAHKDYEDLAVVAEGKTFDGAITYPGNNLVAAAFDGVLRWTAVGAELPALDGDVVFDAEKKEFSTMQWHYTKDGTTKATPTYVEGVYTYFGKLEIDNTIEAYIAVSNGTPTTYGDVVTVAAAAGAGDIIEIIKDVTTENVKITNACTVNGNNHTLTIKQGSTGDLVYVATAVDVTFNNLTLNGGASTYATWDGAYSGKDSNLLDVAAAAGKNIILNNCTIKGYRAEASSNSAGVPIRHNQAIVSFYNCSLIDNISMSTTGTSATGYVLNSSGAGCVSFYGKTVVKDNFGVYINGDSISYIDRGINNEYRDRVYIGELEEGSEIHLLFTRDDKSTAGYTAGVDADGKPYDHSGLVFADSAAKADENGVITATSVSALHCVGVANDYTNLTDEEKEIYEAQNGKAGALFVVAKAGIADGVNGGAAISRDNFALTLYVPVYANYYGTKVVVMVNGVEQDNVSLCEVAVTAASRDTVDPTTVTLTATVGMAELTDAIVVELRDENNNVLASDDHITAKVYADTLIRMSADDLVNNYGVEPDKVIPMKNAMASLLQYGAYVQTYFGYKQGNLPMTDADIAIWNEQELTLNLVAARDLDFANVNNAIKASSSGKLPSGVEYLGVTFTMENQISLRFYFTAETLEGLTFTVGGVSATPKQAEVNGVSCYYIENAHIKTQDLATGAAFVISDSTNNFTYTACPMSYVYYTLTTDNVDVDVDAKLKDACEALYYYFAAAAEYAEFEDNTGFVLVEELSAVSSDSPNAYSAPRNVTEE